MHPFPGMVLSGVGLVAPGGTDTTAFFQALQQPAPETAPPEDPAPRRPGHPDRRVGMDEPRLKMARYMDPVSRNAIVAMRGALRESGIEEHRIAAAPHQYGVVLGTTRGPCVTREGLYASLTSRQGKMVSATLFSHCGYNIAGAMTAIAFGFKGPNLTLAARGDLGLVVLRRALGLLAGDRAHTVFAGVSECDGAARPTGIPFGEFAYWLCLERKDTARKRGATLLAEVDMEDRAVPQRHPLPREERAAATVQGFETTDGTAAPSVRKLTFPLPGLPAGADRYLTLFLVGLLACDPGIRDRFSAVTCAAGTGPVATRIRLAFPEREPAAV